MLKIPSPEKGQTGREMQAPYLPEHLSGKNSSDETRLFARWQQLAQGATSGKSRAAWEFLQGLLEQDEHALIILAMSNDDRLLWLLLEYMALGTWAGKHVPALSLLTSSRARMSLKSLWISGTSIDPSKAERVLIEVMHDHRAALRQVAAHLLGLLRTATAVPILLEALHDPNRAVQIQVIQALGRLGGSAVVHILVNLLPQSDDRLNHHICSALVQLGPAAIPALLVRSTSPSSWIRWHCLSVLGRLHDERALPVLVDALAAPEQSIAWIAAKGLVPFGRRCVGPILYLLLSTSITPWLVETVSYVFQHQRNPAIKPYLSPIVVQMHTPSFRIGTPFAAQRALAQLVADGMSSACGITHAGSWTPKRQTAEIPRQNPTIEQDVLIALEPFSSVINKGQKVCRQMPK